MIRIIKKMIIFVFIFFGFCLAALFLLKVPNYYPKNINSPLPNDFFGITYSKKYAEELGLDYREAYIEILNDLKPKYIRMPIYWNDIEKEEGVFNFDDYVFMIEEGEKRNVEFILSFGMRAPRWPECHIPEWINPLDEQFLQEKTLSMLKNVVEKFKNYSSIAYFQVENEPLLNTFGVCPKADYNFLKEEIRLVKSLDERPIIISATGELSLWSREIEISDVFGTTMYRVVHNPFLGYIKYPYTEGFYRAKAKALNSDFNNIFIVELQAEPWMSLEEILNLNNQEHLKSFSVDQFRANLRFAANTGFKRTYLWGVEWWYFRNKIANDPSYWNLAKDIFK